MSHDPRFFLGRRTLPRQLSAFELQNFFTFTPDERKAILNRRGTTHRLGLALQIGFLRLSGRPLGSVHIVPPALWQHLAAQFDLVAPEIASLRALYRRGRTLYDHQQLAATLLGIRPMSEHQRRALVRALRDQVTRQTDRDALLVFARRWQFSRQLIVSADRALRAVIHDAVTRFEQQWATELDQTVGTALLNRWRDTLIRPHDNGNTLSSWLGAPPARHGERAIDEVLARINVLYELQTERFLNERPVALIRHYALRLKRRKPAASARVKEPVRTLEAACFLRYTLLTTTDQLLLMVHRRVAQLWRHARATVPDDTVDWQRLYLQLQQQIATLSADKTLSATALRKALHEVLSAPSVRPPSRAQRARERLLDAIRPLRHLLQALVKLPWQASAPEHPLLIAIARLQALYVSRARVLPDTDLPPVDPLWRDALNGADRDRAFRALEAATLLALRRALRNGTVWLEHSLQFCRRDALFIPTERWQTDAAQHYRQLALPRQGTAFLKPLIARIDERLQQLATAVDDGRLTIDDGALRLPALNAEPEDPEVTTLRAALQRRLGDVQLPELVLAVDAEVRFSWAMLGREPRSADELLYVYAGLLAHATALTATECARMIPSLSANGVRQAMHWVSDEHRLHHAMGAVFAFLQRHPIAASWGRDDLASADMMSLETSRRVWQARLDPRRQTPAVGVYSHTHDRWGLFYAQPIILNERQAGAAIEGVIRTDGHDIAQLAVDTHGYTDFAMALARLLGFDLCPRLKSLSHRRLFVAKHQAVPPSLASIVNATIDPGCVERQWDRFVQLAAAVATGQTSAVTALTRFGSAARGDPMYEAGVQLGQLLRTLYLADYWLNIDFRREIQHVLNRGEAANALKRALYTGRVSPRQAKDPEQLRTVAASLNLLANIVMAWNTQQMQHCIDDWNQRRAQPIPPALTGKIAPTRLDGINLRGTFRFPIDQFAGQLLPTSHLKERKKS